MKEPQLSDACLAISASKGVNAISPLLLTEIFHSFEEAVVVANIHRQIVYVNSAAERLFGYSKNELYGQATKLLYANASDFTEQGKKRFNPTSRLDSQNYRVVYRRSDGEQFLGMTTGAAMRTESEEVVGYIGVIRPARSADQSLDALQKIHTITADVAMSHDDKIASLLRIGLNHFGLEIAILSHITGKNYTVEYCLDLNEQLQPATQFDVSGTYCVHTLSANKTVGFHFVAKSEIKDHPCYENFKLESYIGTPIRLGGDVYGTINFSSPAPVEPFCKDDFILMELLSDTISYLLYKKISETEMEALARIDELTGLPNRRATWERLNELIEQANRSAQPLCVLSIDIDHFKKINDQWGHAVGDLALIQFARVVSSLGRKTDFCGRIGGEEFVFVLPGINLAAGEKFANRLRQSLAVAPVALDSGESLSLSVSIGIALHQVGESLQRLLGRADDAMYKAKQQGRDQVCQ